MKNPDENPKPEPAPKKEPEPSKKRTIFMKLLGIKLKMMKYLMNILSIRIQHFC